MGKGSGTPGARKGEGRGGGDIEEGWFEVQHGEIRFDVLDGLFFTDFCPAFRTCFWWILSSNC